MMLLIDDLEVDVRESTESDVPLLLAFFRSMATFENLTISATEDSIRAALFGGAPAARALIASADGRPIGYAVYFFTFSTMLGERGLWLEDLFIEPDFRGRGIGRALMAYLADIAAQNRCGRFEWIVLDWNEAAIRFYERLGATVLKEWHICRLDKTRLARVAATLPVRTSGS